MGHLASILGLALLSSLNPTLLAAAMVMMYLPHSRRLLVGYLLGAFLTSVGPGLAIVFSLHGSAGVEASRHTVSPLADIALGLIVLLLAVVLKTGRWAALRARRERRKAAKQGVRKEPWPQRTLGRGSARTAFAVGAVLSFPGVAYLLALDRMAKLDAGAVPTVLLVLAFCLIQMLLLELPLLGFLVAPERTQRAVVGFRAWLVRSGGRVAANAALVIGALLLFRGLITIA